MCVSPRSECHVTRSGQLPPPPSQQCPEEPITTAPSIGKPVSCPALAAIYKAVTLRVSAAAAENMGSEGEGLRFESWLCCFLALLTFSGFQCEMRIITVSLSGLGKLIHMKVYWSRFSREIKPAGDTY